MTKAKSKTAESTAPATPALLVFGLDEQNKPRAARFGSDKPELVTKAAQLLHLKTCAATTPELQELAQRLPSGRLYANGRGFVPHVRRDLYSKLLRSRRTCGTNFRAAGMTSRPVISS